MPKVKGSQSRQPWRVKNQNKLLLCTAPRGEYTTSVTFDPYTEERLKQAARIIKGMDLWQ